jgi:hypothetical protein
MMEVGGLKMENPTFQLPISNLQLPIQNHKSEIINET